MSKQKYVQTTTADGTALKKHGREHYSHAIADARVNARRDDAMFRQSEHDALSLLDKIAKAKSRRGNSKKELARLEALVETKPVVKVVPVALVPVEAAVTEKKARTPKSKVVKAAKTQHPAKS
jgi:hypothetical protein